MKASARLALVLAAASMPAIGHAQSADVSARLRSYDDAVVAAMKAGGLAPRTAAFEGVVRDYYDMPTIAALVVGQGWSTMGAADRAAVTKALAHHSAVSLARNFGRYGGERFTVSPQVTDRGLFKLATVTVKSSDSSNTIVYRLRHAGGEWRIIDGISNSVSQLALQRADLAGTLDSGGADGLVKKLGELDAVR